MPVQLKAIVFDIDGPSLASVRRALPGWHIDIISGATAGSVARTCDLEGVDLLVVAVRGNGTETLRLCRLLSFYDSYSDDFRQKGPERFRRNVRAPAPARRTEAPLLVLVSPGQETLVGAVLEAGAHSCLVRPIHFKDVVSMLAHARKGNQPGRHTLKLEGSQSEDPWRDSGGES